MGHHLGQRLCAIAGLALAAAGANAASVTYNLTYSNDDASHITGGFNFNVLQHGTVYATVTIDDEGTPGLINFTVSPSSFWDGQQDSNFGFQAFGFNILTPGAATGITAADVINLPGNWAATVDLTNGTARDGMGNFDVAIGPTAQPGQNRFTPLTFSIDLGGDQSATDGILDYVAGSIPGANGSFLFAAHLVAFTDQNPADPVGSCVGQTPDANNQDCNYLVSGWFSVPAAPIPVPAAVWLFGSALGLLAWVRRRAA